MKTPTNGKLLNAICSAIVLVGAFLLPSLAFADVSNFSAIEESISLDYIDRIFLQGSQDIIVQGDESQDACGATALSNVKWYKLNSVYVDFNGITNLADYSAPPNNIGWDENYADMTELPFPEQVREFYVSYFTEVADDVYAISSSSDPTTWDYVCDTQLALSFTSDEFNPFSSATSTISSSTYDLIEFDILSTSAFYGIIIFFISLFTTLWIWSTFIR